MPDYGLVDPTDYDTPSASTFDSSSLSAKYVDAAARHTQPQGYGVMSTLLGDIAAAPIDLADTVLSSIPGMKSAFGIERGDLNQKMLDLIDKPGVTNFYRENKGGIEVASAVFGIIGAEMATGGLISAAAPFVATMRGASFAKKALRLDDAYKAALANVSKVDMGLAASGKMGAAQYTEALSVLPSFVNPTAAGIVEGTVPSMFTRAATASKARFLGSAKGAARAGATEAMMAVGLNQNSFLYSEDESTNILFGAIGIGAGAGFGLLGANYAMRKFVNSDSMQRVYANALDNTGLESALLDGGKVADALKSGVYEGSYLGSLKGSTFDKVTAHMVEAGAKGKEGVDPSMVSRIAAQRTNLAMEEAQKATISGIPHVSGTGFSMNAPGYGNHFRQILVNDPSAMTQAELVGGAGNGLSISKIVADYTEATTGRLQKIQETMADPKRWGRLKPQDQVNMQTELKQLRLMDKLTPVPYIDGEATTLAHAQSFENWIEPEIRSKTDGGISTWEAVHKDSKKAMDVGLDSDLSIYLPNGKTINDADHFDMLNLYRSAQQAIKETLQTPGGALKLPENPNWFQLDMAEQILSKSKGTARVQFPGTMTRETAAVESFAQKVDALAAATRTDDPTDIAKLRVRYNLPRLSAYEVGVMGSAEHPLDMIVRGAIAKGGGDAVRGMGYAELLGGITDAAKINGLAVSQGKQAKSLIGNTFDFLSDFEGKPTNPLVVMKRPFTPNSWTPDDLAERLAIRKVHTLGALTSPSADELTRTLVGNAVGSPDFVVASRVSGLADVQMQASLPGMGNLAPNSSTRNFTDSFTTTEHKFRDTPVMQAVTRLREQNERVAQNYMRQVFETNMGPILPKLNGPRNAESKLLLDQFHSHAQGWQLAEEAVEVTLPSGKKAFQFELADTVANQDRFKQQFGREMVAGESLLSPNGTPMVLDEIGMEAQRAFNRITEERRIQQNVLSSALGLPEKRAANWYVPAPNVEGKIVGHTYDALNRIVPGGTVIANTQEQFAREVARLSDAKLTPNSPLLREGHIFRSQDEVKEFATAMDRAQQEMVNPGRTFVAPSKQNYGGSAGATLNPDAFADSMKTMRDGFLQHGREIQELLLKDQINAAKMRSTISEGAKLGNQSATQAQKAKGIFDYYVQEATGASPLNSERSWFGRKYNELESSANAFLRERAPAFGAASTATQQRANQVFAQVRDYFKVANPYTLDAEAKVEFEKMATRLGEHMPFKSAAEKLFAERGGSLPPTLAGITGDINRFEATWMLRMLEPVQAVMNLGGMINAAPAVVRHLSMRPAETVEEYALRVGHNATVFNTPEGKSFGVMDMGKLMYQGFKRGWSREAHVDYDFMAQNGFLDFQMAEFKKAFNAADSDKGAIKRFLTGDPSKSELSSGYGKGLVGWLSVLTDKSEEFSRSWGHMMGLGLAESLGIEGRMAQHSFAHDIANKMIANYSPANRPEVFQGAIGAPIGLFQSYIWNYYQRLFRYAETGDLASIGAQYATQAGLFGLKTVPGFSEMNDLMFAGHDGKTSPYESIVGRFGQQAGDVLMAGTIGNIPTLFGGDAIDLTSRGDTTFRTPVFNMPAVFSTGKKIFDGIGAAASAVMGNNPDLTMNQLAEIASNTIPNRPIAGMIEQFMANQNDTDPTGQLISHSQSLMEGAYRVMGTRSVRQSRDLEAFYANKSAQEIQSSKMETLRNRTRELIRGNGNLMDGLPDLYEGYVESGGDPRKFKQWQKAQFEAATTTRSQRQLADALKSTNPIYETRIDTLLNAGVTLPEEDTVDEQAFQLPPDTMDGPTPTNQASDDMGLMYGVTE